MACCRLWCPLHVGFDVHEARDCRTPNRGFGVILYSFGKPMQLVVKGSKNAGDLSLVLESCFLNFPYYLDCALCWFCSHLSSSMRPGVVVRTRTERPRVAESELRDRRPHNTPEKEHLT